MKKNSLPLLAMISVLFSALLFSGCRTMEGAGRDIERGGEKIQDAAR
jgi:entericidin B